MKRTFAPNGPAVGTANPSQITRPTGIVADGFAMLDVMVDWTRREVCHRGGRRCRLSVRETALLACLARKAGTPVSRDEILLQVWQLDPRRTATRTIDMHISILRRKLDVHGEGPSVLVTVYRVGYMLHPGAILSDDAPPLTGAAESAPWELLTGGESISTL